MAQEVGLFCNNIVPHFNYRTTRTGSCVSGRILFFQINLVVYLHFISFQNYPASYNKSWFCSLYFVCYTYVWSFEKCTYCAWPCILLCVIWNFISSYAKHEIQSWHFLRKYIFHFYYYTSLIFSAYLATSEPANLLYYMYFLKWNKKIVCNSRIHNYPVSNFLDILDNVQ